MVEWYESIELWQIAIPAIIGIFMFVITYHMWNSQKSKNKTDALFKVFSLLSSPEIRQAREKIHKHGKPTEPLPLTAASEIPNDVDLVLASLDQVSILVLKKIVDYELFFEIYGQLVVRDYMRLENVINEKRDKNALTLQHFKDLKEEFEGRTDLGEVKLY